MAKTTTTTTTNHGDYAEVKATVIDLPKKGIEPHRFDCMCHWPMHSLHIYPFTEAGDVCISVSVLNSSAYENGVWQRIKHAWHILRGDDHLMSEIILDSSEISDFIDYVSSWRLDTVWRVG